MWDVESLGALDSACLHKFMRFVAGDGANVTDLLRVEKHTVVALGNSNHLWSESGGDCDVTRGEKLVRCKPACDALL